MRVMDDTIRISVRHEDFRVDLARPFIPVAIGALVASELFFILRGTSSLQMLLIGVPVAVMLTCGAILMLMCLRYKFEVGPEGIDSFDFLRRVHRTPWDAVQSIQFFSLFGLDYLVVRVEGHRRALWIPLFVTRYELLRDLLVTYADASHRLADKLEQFDNAA